MAYDGDCTWLQGEGETAILTLADRNILEEGSDEEEVLENVLSVRLLIVLYFAQDRPCS